MIQTIKDKLVQPVIELLQRFLDIIIVIDCSDSMSGNKIAMAIQAISEADRGLAEAQKQHPEVEFRVRSIAFSNDAWWHTGPEPVEPGKASWTNLGTGGLTATGKAVGMLADTFSKDKMQGKGYPPVMVLLSDGANTDGDAYDKEITRLDSEPWGAKAIRLSIGIGDHYDRSQLDKFCNQPSGTLEAKNAVDLANYLVYSMVTVPLGTIRSARDPDNSTAIPAPPAGNPKFNNDPKLGLY